MKANRRALFLLAACVVLVAAWLLTRGGEGGGPPRPAFRTAKGGAGAPGAANTGAGYERFKLVQTRNVFDPDRRAPHAGPVPAATPAPARADYVALTGTFFDGERKQLAFFSGSRPEYNKVLTVRDQIAGATINKITGANVEVLRDGRPVTVAVGQTVPFDGSAPAAAPAPATSAPPLSTAAGGSPPPPPAPGADGSQPAVAANAAPDAVPASSQGPPSSKQEEIRRRMEERRRQEQK